MGAWTRISENVFLGSRSEELTARYAAQSPLTNTTYCHLCGGRSVHDPAFADSLGPLLSGEHPHTVRSCFRRETDQISNVPSEIHRDPVWVSRRRTMTGRIGAKPRRPFDDRLNSPSPIEREECAESGRLVPSYLTGRHQNAGMGLRLDCIYGTSWFAGAGVDGVGPSQDVAYCADAPRMKAPRSLLCCTRLGSWTYIMWPAG
jgi:hypothetical protein